MKTSRELEDGLERLKDERSDLLDKIKPLNQRLSKVDLQITKIEDDIVELNRKPRVTDHAVIRWLERKYGFDFEKQRNELLDDSSIKAINMGASKIKRDGNVLVIKDKAIVTVI